MVLLSEPAEGGFCARVWLETAMLQQAICDHPFNVALADGTLDRDRFAFYLVQDRHYLQGFSQALAAASTRADEPDDGAFFAASARTALLAERGLHGGYLEKLGVADDIPTAPSALAYVSFLHSVALTRPYPVLAAALLPCFWVYAHVGGRIADAVDLDGHPYADWISLYADEEFTESVENARAIVDRLAVRNQESTVDSMRSVFVRCCEYEWMFWDAAWRRETWPTAQWV